MEKHFTTQAVDKDSLSSVNCDVRQGWVVVLGMQQFLSERCVSATITITCNRSYWDLLKVWSIIMEKQFTTKDVDKDSQCSVNCDIRQGWVVVLVEQQFLSELCVSATITITCNRSFWDLMKVWSIIMEKQFTTKDVDKDSQSSVNCDVRQGWVVVLVEQQFLPERCVSATITITCNRSYWDLLEVWSIIIKKQFTTKDVDKDSQCSVNCDIRQEWVVVLVMKQFLSERCVSATITITCNRYFWDLIKVWSIIMEKQFTT